MITDEWLLELHKSNADRTRSGYSKFMINIGLKPVWGIPNKALPIVGLPKGKARFRFRNNSFAKVFVKNQCGIAHYVLIDNLDGTWGLLPQGGNIVL